MGAGFEDFPPVASSAKMKTVLESDPCDGVSVDHTETNSNIKISYMSVMLQALKNKWLSRIIASVPHLYRGMT